MRSACVLRCATSAGASPPKATRCWCRILSIASRKAPQFESAATFNFNDPGERAKLPPLMGSIGAAGAAEKDAVAYIAFLDAQTAGRHGEEDRHAGLLHGRRAGRATAAAVPDRVGAGASFHGGGLVTDKPDSPYLLAPKIKARMYFGIAANDDQRQPDAKDKLREAFAAAKVPAEIEVYPAKHGWCVPDMPSRRRRADLQRGRRRAGLGQAGRPSTRQRSSEPARRRTPASRHAASRSTAPRPLTAKR